MKMNITARTDFTNRQNEYLEFKGLELVFLEMNICFYKADSKNGKMNFKNRVDQQSHVEILKMDFSILVD